jgi:hypothetical protein
MRMTLLLAFFLFAAQLLPADEITAAEASNHVGENTSVCGLVASVHQVRRSRGKPTLIDLDKPYPGQEFTILIWDKDRPAFGNIRSKCNGRQVCAFGVISNYRGKPEMVLHGPDALQAK